MNIHTYPGLVLSVSDYKDSDRLLTVFTPENGVLKAVAKGVKKSGAKLKFASEVFNFGNYTFAEKNGFLTVTGCEQISDLSFHMAETDRYICGSIMAELTFLAVGESDPTAFSLFIKVLKIMIYDEVSPFLAALKYSLYLWSESGYSKPITPYNGQETDTASALVSYVFFTEPEKLKKDVSAELTKNCLKRLLKAFESSYSAEITSAKFIV